MEKGMPETFKLDSGSPESDTELRNGQYTKITGKA